MYESRIKATAKNNKYTRWYLSIIERAKARITSKIKKHARIEARELLGYVESHHVYPACLCSRDEKLDKDNVVHLTAREHFVCHWLLCKMFDGEVKHKMQYGFSMFLQSSENHQRNLTSRQFETVKRQLSEAAAYTARMRFTGVPKSETHKENMRLGWAKRPRGVKLSEEHKRNIGLGAKGRVKSPEECKRLSDALTGRNLSVEQKQKLSLKAKERIAEKNSMFGKRKYIHPTTLDRKMFVIGEQLEGFILVKDWNKTQLKGTNAMASKENRAKVGASKIGRKIAINPTTGERKYVFPDSIPVGFVLKALA